MHPGVKNPVPVLSRSEFEVGGVNSSGKFRTFVPTGGRLTAISES